MVPLTDEERVLVARALEALGLVDVRYDGRRVSALLPDLTR